MIKAWIRKWRERRLEKIKHDLDYTRTRLQSREAAHKRSGTYLKRIHGKRWFIEISPTGSFSMEHDDLLKLERTLRYNYLKLKRRLDRE